jgi:hypothetical protein
MRRRYNAQLVVLGTGAHRAAVTRPTFAQAIRTSLDHLARTRLQPDDRNEYA